MKNTIIAVLLLLVSILANAQQNDESLKKETIQKIQEKFPQERLFNFEYSQSLNRDFDSELFDEKYQDAEIKNQEKFNATVNIPIYRKNKWHIIASGNYQFNRFEFDDVPSNLSPTYFERNGTADFHYLAAEIKMMHFSQLFNKPILYMGSIKADGTEKEFARLKGSLGFSFMLKRTERTVFGLGLMGFLDSSQPYPLIPTLMWSHKFKNSKWEMDMLIPDRLLFQRPIGKNGRLSLGSTFGNTGFYVENEGPGEDLLEYSQLEIKTGFKYEHRINKFLIGSFQGGVQNIINSNLMEKGDASGDEIYTNSQDMTGYFKVGISILPFGK
ncbi:hypothetical protein GCQ56_18285 [Marinifilum sp. N1E240]|uniref:hypothetical protein n=1 Tax=Marinifilum sp. N1E240 TaxID=2608082 RepID=UPI00128DF864|nr:hypothetical protein [Marinifilum sp. N1E240]MPQ48950.1 hypothetical protein [Marinifilum sp. N1E240]